MKLLLDENISSKLVKFFTKYFPESSHIDLLQMQGTTDTSIWEYALAENYIIVSKDNDFRQRSFLFSIHKVKTFAFQANRFISNFALAANINYTRN